jgi:hypothetical protein
MGVSKHITASLFMVLSGLHMCGCSQSDPGKTATKQAQSTTTSSRAEAADGLPITEGFLGFAWASKNVTKLGETTGPASITLEMAGRKAKCYAYEGLSVTWLTVPLRGVYFFVDDEKGMQLVLITVQTSDRDPLAHALSQKYGQPIEGETQFGLQVGNTGDPYLTQVTWEKKGMYWVVGDGLRSFMIERIRESTKPEVAITVRGQLRVDHDE